MPAKLRLRSSLLLDGAVESFEDGRRKERDQQAADEQEQFEQFSRLRMEVEWL